MAAETKAMRNVFFQESSDIVMVLGVMGILITMLLPLPPFILDLLLALNISISIIILITVMYTESTLEFSIFPSVLLVTTLFRLSLNVASTRLILLHGNEGQVAAGAIIKSFGSFVVGGNYVIGMIIFAILVIINFMVITKGSGRIAEVAARFTLDGMPGKQMAIDADLNAGLIDEPEARARREEIENESKFHGAMDGASKFVKGDASAGIIITIINIVGGFIIGVLQKNMTLVDAAQNYTLLTVGDGLVSQIPALIISTSAGILVTRASSEDRMGKEFAEHIFANATPIYIGSFIVFIFALIPGLPFIPFTVLAIGLSVFVYFVKQAKPEVDEQEMVAEEAAKDAGPEDVEHLLRLDAMEVEVGYGLIPLVDREQEGSLLDRIKAIRRQFATDLGIVVPPIHIRDNLKLKASEYRIIIKGVEMTKVELMVNHLLAMDPGGISQKLDGIPTVEPAFNLPAIWIPKDKEEDAKFSGYTVVDNSTVIATHLSEVIKSNSAELLGRQDVQKLMDNLSRTNPKAVEELIPNLMSVGGVQKVLQNMLRERVSIRDLLTIVETLADFAPMSKDPDLLTEYVRQKLARSILEPYIMADGMMPIISVDQIVEDDLGRAIQHTEHGSFLSVDPNVIDGLVTSIKQEVEKTTSLNMQPIILTSPGLRRHLRKIVEQFAPTVPVISQAEIIQNIRLKAVGKVTFKHAS